MVLQLKEVGHELKQFGAVQRHLRTLPRDRSAWRQSIESFAMRSVSWDGQVQRLPRHWPRGLQQQALPYVQVGGVNDAEPSGEPEPPITSVLKSTFSGGGPVTAVVRGHRT